MENYHNFGKGYLSAFFANLVTSDQSSEHLAVPGSSPEKIFTVTPGI